MHSGVGHPSPVPVWYRRPVPWRPLLASALPLSGALWLYAPVVGFSFLMDDSFDLTIARRASVVAILTQSMYGSTYFRPLTFLLYKAIQALFDGYSPVPYHALSLTLHVVNGLLLLVLLRRSVGWGWAVLPASLFVTFPFSYQAVQIVCSLPHLVVTTLALGALLVWTSAPRSAGRARLLLRILGVSLAFLAPAFHENGVLVGFVLIGHTLLFPFGKMGTTIRREWAWLAALLAGPTVYLLWSSWATGRSRATVVSGSDVGRNLLWWVQAAAYPLTRQLALVFDPRWLAGHARGTVLATGLCGLLAALVLHAGGSQLRLALLALGLAFIAFLPAALLLRYAGYLEDAPRLLYPVAAAIATFWGLLPRALVRRRAASRLLSVLAVGFLGLCLVQSAVFVARRTAMAQRASVLQEAVVTLARENPGWPLVIIDAPAWLAFDRYEYPLGHFGMPVQPAYHGFDALLEARLGWRQPVRSLVNDPPVFATRYRFGPHGTNASAAELEAWQRAGWLVASVEAENGRLLLRPRSLDSLVR